MKKGYLLIFVVFMTVILTACDKFRDSPTSSKEPTTSSTVETKYPEGDHCEQADLSEGDEWKAVWCEEFDYTGAPDPSKWNIEHKGDGFGNNEKQFYTRRKENVYVEDGNLRITAKKENYSGLQYTSAKLMSNGKGDFKYGKIVVRAKLPKGRGTWPAIWMMPTESVYGGWPNSGEIDIMEHVGYNPNYVHGTIHTGNYNHNIGTQKGGSIRLSDVFNTYHTYSIEWDPMGITWYVDGEKYYEFKNDEETNPDVNSANWPFDQKFYLILNVAMGGNWGGAQGIDPIFKESSMYIDYVRVYEKDYETLDQEQPASVTNFGVHSNLPTNTKITWDKAVDDQGVSHYEVYLDGELLGETPSNGYTLTSLEPKTEVELKVIAVDFVGNKSDEAIYYFTSGDYPLVTEQVKASSYSEMKGIFLENTSDEGGGQNVAYIDPGDYLVYKLSVKETGAYRVMLRVAAMQNAHEAEIIRVNQDGNEELLTKVNFEATGGWQNWQTVHSNESFDLNEGTILIKIKANSKDFNLNWIQFEKVVE